MKIQYYYILLVFLFINLSGYCQYSISGYINTEEKNKIIYLSLLRFNEENAIYPKQIIISTRTDSTGYFKITGQLLADENKLYRIHSNTRDSDPLLEFIETGKEKNHLNFIFSNNDTLFFPKEKSIWFSDAQNTNFEDKEWRNAIVYESKLLKEYSKAQNSDAIVQSKNKFLREYKSFCTDSLSGSLVKLLGFAHLKKNANISSDFENDPVFYNNLLDDLDQDYTGVSYFSQFEAEISKLSASNIKQKYVFHKGLNYILGIIILLLLLSQLYLLLKLKAKRRQELNTALSTLTSQEEKVAKLICEGKSNKEIATQLFVSLSTIKSHIGNINSKLNVTNRKQLVGKLENHTRD